MINQPVFLRILIPKRDDCLLSEITLCSVRIAREFKEVIYYVLDDNVYYIDDDWGIMVSAFVVWVMNQRRLLTFNYDIRASAFLTRIELIFNGTVARRTWKGVRHGEDGEEREKKCEGFGNSEVHVCVRDWKSICSSECWCVRLVLVCSTFQVDSFYHIHRVGDINHAEIASGHNTANEATYRRY